MPAQEAFRALLRDHVAPELRALGFRGSGTAFRLEIPDAIALLGFQRSLHSRRDAVSFTVNLTAGRVETWEAARRERAWLPERPSANSRYPGGLWHGRIGPLLPDGEDRWWEVTASTDLVRLAGEVVAAVRDAAVPALRTHAEGLAPDAG